MSAKLPRLARFAVASGNLMDSLSTLILKSWRGFLALHYGLWMGLLSADQLEAITVDYYSRDLHFLNEEHSRDGLKEWEAKAVETHITPGTSVLVPSAGAGREVLALAAMGYAATGYDPASDLVDLGNNIISETESEAILLLSSGSDPPAGLNPLYQWVLFGWGGISHVHRTETRVALFRTMHDLLEPKGVLIVSFWERPERNRSLTVIYRVATTMRKLRRSRDTVELGDWFADYFIHWFTSEEIASELAAAGFHEIDRSSHKTALAHLVCRRS